MSQHDRPLATVIVPDLVPPPSPGRRPLTRPGDVDAVESPPREESPLASSEACANAVAVHVAERVHGPGERSAGAPKGAAQSGRAGLDRRRERHVDNDRPLRPWASLTSLQREASSPKRVVK